jgi:peptidoglycan/xylan/chitin deacetylase (PgdA/CDA1 family)
MDRRSKKATGEKGQGIPVLMYHALEDEEHPAGYISKGDQIYVLSVSQFRDQMEYLYRNHFSTFLLEELLSLDNFPEKTVVLTFDDGHDSNYILALPILQQYGFKAEFFITTGWIGKPHFMTEDQIQGLHQAGMGVGSHGVTHDFLNDLNEQDCEMEFMASMDVLREITGREAISFSAPGGRVSSNVSAIAGILGYHSVCTSQPGMMAENNSPYSIPRFALRKDTTYQSFAAIIQKDEAYLRRLKRRNSLLCFAKWILGNNIYEGARVILLRFRRRR